MPRRTNCSLGALYDSCLNREDDLKYEIIRERVFVTVPDKDLSFDNVDKDDYAQPTDIKHILDRDQIQIEYSSDVLENIRANNDIYILTVFGNHVITWILFLAMIISYVGKKDNKIAIFLIF